MVDQKNVDLLMLAGKHTNLRKMGREYRGTCPIHNGKNRTSFAVWQENGVWRWFCQSCGKGGDAIDFIQAMDEVGFKEAVRRLNLDAGEYKATKRPAREPEPAEPAAAPAGDWQTTALAFVERCEAALWSEAGTKALALLRARGFSDDTIKAARLGYNAAASYSAKAKWGLNDRDKDVWLPAGIVMPWLVAGELWKVAIRRNNGEPKYYFIPGGSNALYNADNLRPGKPAIIVEAVLDALAVQQEAGDLITPVVTGTTGARRVRWYARLARRALLLALDNDEAGQKAEAYWRDIFTDALVWRPLFDDPAAMLEKGLDVRGWIVAGLQYAGAKVAPAQTILPAPAALQASAPPEPSTQPSAAASGPQNGAQQATAPITPAQPCEYDAAGMAERLKVLREKRQRWRCE